jgi:7-carboxy-7-deazaguanine synthase
MGIDEVLAEVESMAEGYPPRTGKERLPLVELTGGEPLIQPASFTLMSKLCDRGYTVLLETSGAHALKAVDRRVRCIVDVKGPSSGELERNHWPNLAGLREIDEVKFVLGTIEDYEWMKRVLAEHKLAEICPVLVSWAAPLTSGQKDKSLKQMPVGQNSITRRGLVESIIADRLPVRFQLQMHKFIWPVDQRGV